MSSIRPETKAFITNSLLALAGLYLAIALFGTIRRNYELQREISAVEESNKLLEQSNLELQYQIAYFETELYQDKAARAKLGLQAPGESVIILPKEEATKKVEEKAKPKRSNFAQWIDFLRGMTS